MPTPIGNLGDLSQRVMDTLAEVDFIAAEDTRISVKILNHLGIKKTMVSLYYRHNAETSGETILGRLMAGESCALVTDAGTPAISDPGELLVQSCAQADIPVVAIGGLNERTIPELAGTGADGAAVVSAIFAAEDIEEETRRLRAAVQAALGA